MRRFLGTSTRSAPRAPIRAASGRLLGLVGLLGLLATATCAPAAAQDELSVVDGPSGTAPSTRHGVPWLDANGEPTGRKLDGLMQQKFGEDAYGFGSMRVRQQLPSGYDDTRSFPFGGNVSYDEGGRVDPKVENGASVETTIDRRSVLDRGSAIEGEDSGDPPTSEPRTAPPPAPDSAPEQGHEPASDSAPEQGHEPASDSDSAAEPVPATESDPPVESESAPAPADTQEQPEDPGRPGEHGKWVAGRPLPVTGANGILGLAVASVATVLVGLGVLAFAFVRRRSGSAD